MIIVDKKPVPLYELDCIECKSKIRYKKADVSWTGYLTCPICGVSNWAATVCPVAGEGTKDCMERLEEMDETRT